MDMLIDFLVKYFAEMKKKVAKEVHFQMFIVNAC